VLGGNQERPSSCTEESSPPGGDSGWIAGQRRAHHRPRKGAEVRALAYARSTSLCLPVATRETHVQPGISCLLPRTSGHSGHVLRPFVWRAGTLLGSTLARPNGKVSWLLRSCCVIVTDAGNSGPTATKQALACRAFQRRPIASMHTGTICIFDLGAVPEGGSTRTSSRAKYGSVF